MSTDPETPRRARDEARARYEALDLEARAIRAQLTQAQRRARVARRAFERARLAYLDACDACDGTAKANAKEVTPC